MLVTIHNLPSYFDYPMIKSLIQNECQLSSGVIFDNLVNEGENKRVTVGLAKNDDFAVLKRNINKLVLNGKKLFVQIIQKDSQHSSPEPEFYNNNSETYNSDEYAFNEDTNFSSTGQPISSGPIISEGQVLGDNSFGDLKQHKSQGCRVMPQEPSYSMAQASFTRCNSKHQDSSQLPHTQVFQRKEFNEDNSENLESINKHCKGLVGSLATNRKRLHEIQTQCYELAKKCRQESLNHEQSIPSMSTATRNISEIQYTRNMCTDYRPNITNTLGQRESDEQEFIAATAHNQRYFDNGSQANELSLANNITYTVTIPNDVAPKKQSYQSGMNRSNIQILGENRNRISETFIKQKQPESDPFGNQCREPSSKKKRRRQRQRIAKQVATNNNESQTISAAATHTTGCVPTEFSQCSKNLRKNLAVSIISLSGLLSHTKALKVAQALEAKVIVLSTQAMVRVRPEFWGTPAIHDGLLKLRCVNESTREWVETSIVEINSELALDLVVTSQIFAPGQVSCAIKIPGKWTSYKIIGEMLELQNHWAQVNRWVFLKSYTNKKKLYTQVIVRIPKDIIQEIINHSYKLHFGLGTIYVSILTKEKLKGTQKNKQKPNSKDPSEIKASACIDLTVKEEEVPLGTPDADISTEQTEVIPLDTKKAIKREKPFKLTSTSIPVKDEPLPLDTQSSGKEGSKRNTRGIHNTPAIPTPSTSTKAVENSLSHETREFLSLVNKVMNKISKCM